MIYKVEKGIPNPADAVKIKYPFEEMEVGDSFLLKDAEDRDRVRSAAHSYSIRFSDTPFHITVRKTPEGYRVWRIAERRETYRDFKPDAE